MRQEIVTTRKVEKELIEFTKKLEIEMTTTDIVALYEEIEQEHWLSESKVLLMRTIFHSVLDDNDRKKGMGMADEPENTLPMFR